MIEVTTFVVCAASFGVNAAVMLRDGSAVGLALGRAALVLCVGSLSLAAWAFVAVTA